MQFRIEALAADRFRPLYGADTNRLAAAGARRVIADASPGYPCRVSLRDADVGESLLLLNHVHHDYDTPYRACHAIYVIEGAEQARPEPDTVPDVLRSRLLSVRAFNAAHDLIAADVCEGARLEAVIIALGEAPGVRYLHIHNARPGCFAARVAFHE